MTHPDSDSAKVPFGPWKTFKTFVEQDLKAKGIPSHLDHSVFRSKSGTDARYLRDSIRFFGLVEGPNNEPTDKLRQLVQAHGTDAWKPALVGLLSSYDTIVRDVNVERGTQAQLDDAFRRNTGYSSWTLKKAVRLYLSIATEAGGKLSPHFISLRGLGEDGDGNGSAPRTPAARTKRAARRMNTNDEQTDRNTPPPEGVDLFQPLPGRDFRIWVPRDLTDAELEFGLKYLKEYLKLTRKPKGGNGVS